MYINKNFIALLSVNYRLHSCKRLKDKERTESKPEECALCSFFLRVQFFSPIESVEWGVSCIASEMKGTHGSPIRKG